MSYQNVLLEAAYEGNLAIIKAMEGKVNLSKASDFDSRTPLHLAAAAGHLEVVEYLLSKEVEPNCLDRTGETPLAAAIRNEHFEVVKVLQAKAAEQLRLSLWNSENDPVQMVLVHNFLDVRKAGSGVSSTLYGDPGSEQEREEYRHFYDSLRKHHIGAINLRDAIMITSTKEELQQFIAKQLIFVTEESISWQELEEFKKTVVCGMSYEQLGYALTHKFTFKIKRLPDGSLSTHSYETEPVLNALERRFQIVTPKGVVLLGDEKYSHSVNILEFCFRKLGLPIILRLPHPLHLSGSDYILASPELSLIGVGALTNESAARYMLNKDVFGTYRVAVVRDIFDRHRERPLDRIIKVISSNCILLNGLVVGLTNPLRRLVTEYVHVGRKNYQVVRTDVELYEYLTSIGYHVIVIPPEFYEKNSNPEVFNFGNGELLIRSQELIDLIKQDPEFKGSIKLLKAGPSSNFVEKSYLLFRKPSVEPTFMNLNPLPSQFEPIWQTDASSGAKQAARAVLMVAPVGFQTNVETAADNFFMKKVQLTPEEIEHRALLEFSNMHQLLTSHGIQVVLFSSERFHETPDAVFPNNWFTTHSITEQKEPTVVFYPMKTPTRRAERRQYIVSALQSIYTREVSFTQWEMEDFPHYLEGTGVLILDRVNKIAYASLSKRCYSKIARTWGEKLGYRLCLFHATDAENRPIYHTNVMMGIGSSVAIVALETINDLEERKRVESSLRSTGHEIVSITREQVHQFCGNVLEVRAKVGGKHYLVMSARARKAFTPEQIELIKKNVDGILCPNIDMIETIGGGGVRCMMGELF